MVDEIQGTHPQNRSSTRLYGGPRDLPHNPPQLDPRLLGCAAKPATTVFELGRGLNSLAELQSASEPVITNSVS